MTPRVSLLIEHIVTLWGLRVLPFFFCQSMAAERKPPLRWMTSPFLMDSFIFVRRFIRLLKWRLGKEQIRFGFLWPSHLPGPNPKWCLVLLKKCTLALSRPRLVECSNLQRGQIDGNSKVFQAGPQTENIMLLLPLGWCGNCTDADTDVEAMLMLVIQLFRVNSELLFIINIWFMLWFCFLKWKVWFRW